MQNSQRLWQLIIILTHLRSAVSYVEFMLLNIVHDETVAWI